MQIEVHKVTVRTIVGTKGDNVGKTFEIPEVTAYVDLGEKFPEKIIFPVPRGEKHPAPGFYELDLAASLYVDNNGRLSLRQSPRLRPLGK